MAKRRGSLWAWAALFGVAAALWCSPAMAQQGLILDGVGPVSRSMGGASTAAPLDSAGTIYWNPAAIVGLDRSELEFGVELLYASTSLASSLGPLAGSTENEAGAFAIPTIGLVYKPECSCWTFGLGIFGAAGFGTNFKQDSSNPLLTPPPPAGVGVGAVFSKFQCLQIVPAASYQVTDHLAIGFGPVIDLADLMIDPAFFAAPDDANGNGVPTLPSATHGRTTWGAGFQLGMYYATDSCWNFGASFKSPQWFETYRWNSADEIGRGRIVKFDLDLPLIVSLGASYTGIDRTILALDFRYYNYGGTDGFNTAGFNPDGSVRGLDWDSIFAVALGVQYQLTDAMTLRAGYVWNQNPIEDKDSIFNIVSPNILEHTFSLGASYKLSDAWTVSLAWVHAFQNSIEGPIVTPAGAVPGSSVKSEVHVDTLVFGMSVKF